MRILIAGCGYIGVEVGRKLVASGHEVWGIRRSSADFEALHEAGIQPLALDLTQPMAPHSLPHSLDVVLNAVSTRGGEVADYEAVYQKGTQHLLEALQPHPLQRYIMVSSTSVYGQIDGSWVDESSPTEPDSPTSRILIHTEQSLLQHFRTSAFPTVILRAAGIYGPDRGHLFHQFLRGDARLTGDGSRWLNMIHRDDLALALAAAAERATPGEIYNATDNEPVTEFHFFQWLATTLGRPMPPPRESTPTRRKRGATNKRISNRKIKTALQLSWKHPTFREGYGSELARLNIPHSTTAAEDVTPQPS